MKSDYRHETLKRIFQQSPSVYWPQVTLFNNANSGHWNNNQRNRIENDWTLLFILTLHKCCCCCWGRFNFLLDSSSGKSSSCVTYLSPLSSSNEERGGYLWISDLSKLESNQVAYQNVGNEVFNKVLLLLWIDSVKLVEGLLNDIINISFRNSR